MGWWKFAQPFSSLSEQNKKKTTKKKKKENGFCPGFVCLIQIESLMIITIKDFIWVLPILK